jgi:cell division protein ZapA
MAQITVVINGKQYRMACDDGQEDHLTGLAERLNAAIDALRERFGEIGDQRLTVMAALTFADQAAEASQRLARVEHELGESERARVAAGDLAAADTATAANALLVVAERIEALAGKVAGTSPSRANGA